MPENLLLLLTNCSTKDMKDHLRFIQKHGDYMENINVDIILIT